MLLEGTIAEIIVKLNQNYTENIHGETKKPVLYVKLKKALYGTRQAVLLFWRLLSANLKE